VLKAGGVDLLNLEFAPIDRSQFGNGGTVLDGHAMREQIRIRKIERNAGTSTGTSS
jgi:hypothetical protein